MQLFGLVNTLLDKDPTTSKRHLSIQRYSVIPLSTNSGLIGWVPHCDTLHALIRDYREKKKILLNIEHRIMLRMAPDYDHLTLMQKVCTPPPPIIIMIQAILDYIDSEHSLVKKYMFVFFPLILNIIVVG